MSSEAGSNPPFADTDSIRSYCQCPPPLTCPVPARQNLTSPLTCKTGFQSKIKRVGSNPPFDQSFRVVLPFSNVEIFLKNFNNLFSIIVLVYVICTNINSLFLTSANFKCLNYLRFWQYRRNSRVSKVARPFCLRVADTKSKRDSVVVYFSIVTTP